MITDERYKPKTTGLIDVSDRFEVEYWAKKFGIGRDELRWAVQAAGPKCWAVREAIKKFVRWPKTCL